MLDPVVKQNIDEIFGKKLFANPIAVAESWGWKRQTCYGHVCDGTFPVKLTNVAGRKMVALPDFINFLNGHVDESVKKPARKAKRKPAKTAKANETEQPAGETKRKPGRPTNRERAARAAALTK